MAGSLSHIIDENGDFDMSLIENLGDAEEALLECFNLITILSDGDMEKISQACEMLGYVDPWTPDPAGDTPVPNCMQIQM